MRKYTHVVLFTVIAVFLFLFTLNVNLKSVHAENSDPDQALIDNMLTSDSYNQQIQTIIHNNFSSFTISPSDFNDLVTGKNNYRILEITPRTFTDSSDDVSDLSANLEKIKDIYKQELLQHDYTSNYFVSNMPNFTLDVMTIKQFVDNRDDFAGKYDAIVFSSGDYSDAQVVSCNFDYDTSSLPQKYLYHHNHFYYTGHLYGLLYYGSGQLYDDNQKLIYDGQFYNGQYQGIGSLYNNGRMVYTGGFINGQRSCYGVSNDGDGQYLGQWVQGHKEGYGIQFNSYGWFQYAGYFHNGQPAPDYVPRDILNDITDLKANAVINDYVKKGIPVFISNDTLIDPDSKLYQYFHGLSSQYSNVYMLDYNAAQDKSNINFNTALSIMKITELQSNKPNIVFNDKPTDFNDDSSVVYHPSDAVHFDFNLTNADDANLLFYIDINQNGTFETNEIAYTLLIHKGDNSFDYQIPTVYSGLLKYKIVISDGNLNKMYDGTLNIKGEVKEIKVLNVVSDMVKYREGLLDPTLYQNYFQNNGDYKIDIDYCTVKDFSKNNSRHFPCSHYTVMDNYDVILLGQDIFDKSMNPHVYNSIQEQIDKGKPVIFTSSVTKGNNNWIHYFSDELSLSNYRTDLYKLNNNVDKLQVVNNNSFDLYPFNMNDEQLLVPEDLNYALNEEYQMDLDNQNMVPLMNMYNSQNTVYDRFDSYNNYYYMKNNNVVYLNVGNNSFNTYKDIEHKLLVDAIVNLYVQDKAKNQKLEDFFSINYNNNYEDSLINVNDHVKFDFTVFSNQNDTYNYKVYADSNLIQSADITNNQFVNIDMSNFATPNINAINEVYVSVVITNSQGERHTYGFYVYVSNLDNYGVKLSPTTLNNSTNINSTNYLQVDKSQLYSTTYQVQLTNISVEGLNLDRLPKHITLHNFEFTQKIPDNITVDDPSLTFINHTVTKSLGDFSYTLVGDNYVPDMTNPINIEIPFTVTDSGHYTFDKASLTFDGIGSDPSQLDNSSIQFTAIKPLDASMVTPTFNNYLFIPYGSDQISDLTKRFSFEDQASINSITFNKTGNTDIFNLNNNDGVYSITNKPGQVGEESFTMTITDIFGNIVRVPFDVITYVPIEAIDITDQSFDKGTTVELPFSVDTSNIQYSIISQLNLDDSPNGTNVVNIEKDPTNGNQLIVTGSNVGYAHYRFTGYDENGHIITKEITFVVNPKHNDISFNNPFKSLLIGDEISSSDMQNNITILNSTHTFNDFTWTSSDDRIATVDSTGKVIAKNSGTTIITGTVGNISIQLLVKVYDYVSDESGFSRSLDTIKVYQGYEQHLEDYITLVPGTLTKNDVTMTFTIDDPDGIVANFDQSTNTFNTNPDKSGYITIHVTITQKNGNGVVVKEVTDSYQLLIHKIVDPNIDKGDNQS